MLCYDTSLVLHVILFFRYHISDANARKFTSNWVM
jgi:hypothetical protein